MTTTLLWLSQILPVSQRKGVYNLCINVFCQHLHFLLACQQNTAVILTSCNQTAVKQDASLLLAPMLYEAL